MKTYREMLTEMANEPAEPKEKIHLEDIVQLQDVNEDLLGFDNPLKLIRSAGYKIKTEIPSKQGKNLKFFKATDAEDAYTLVKGNFKEYEFSLNGLVLSIKIV